MTSRYDAILKKNGLTGLTSGDLDVRTPIDGTIIGRVKMQKPASVDKAVTNAASAFARWKSVPAPVRGELVRLFGLELEAAKEDLGALVSLECGKILAEGLGEVQEMIDICFFAGGLSRQMYGLTIASERPGHAMRETWQPLGPVGIITAFNFPVAVCAWNLALAVTCGNPVIWKPSEKTPLSALACEIIWNRAVKRFKKAGHDCPPGLLQIIVGGADVGQTLCDHRGVPLISATGSTRMGRHVAQSVAARLGRTLLELGGNNAMIVTQSADLDMAVRAILFGAVGTAGQRCTSLRRLIVHKKIKPKLIAALTKAYESVRIGNPLDAKSLVGPLIDEAAFNAMQAALRDAEKEGGKILVGGGRVKVKGCADGYYTAPALVEMKGQGGIVRHETFAPVLYILSYENFEDAIAMNNDVPQGLSSCIFTTDVRESEIFLSAAGSDCGIANVNIGPSGAEIGGAFGGEKETGGGRESGSDSWKAYMRRQTQTVNYSRALPLAQGVKFDL